MPNNETAGPVTMVTGGAGNLGRAVTRAFLDAGHRVFVPLHKGDAHAMDGLANEFSGRVPRAMVPMLCIFSNDPLDRRCGA